MDRREIHDALGRPLRDLRISVTDRCNFRCTYCMPEEIFGPDYPFLPKNQLLSYEEITRLVRIFASFGVKKIRLTGGEPLLRRGLPELIGMINEVDGIDDVALTTNGSLLKRQAADLKAAGLKRINVSLDTLDDDVFHKLNSRAYGVKRVLEGIEAAAAAGLKVKINVVVQRGVNEDDIVPIARYFRGSGHIVRYIEFMDVGNSNDWNLEKVVTKKEIIARINAEMPLEPIDPNYYGEVASRYRYKGSDEEIGVISSVSDTFCSSCTRARLSADGFLYTCLFASEGHDLRTPLRSGESEEALRRIIARIWGARRDRYSDERFLQTEKNKRKKIEMSYIGG